MAPMVVLGYGETNKAVVRALQARDHELVVVDDRPSPDAIEVAGAVGIELRTGVPDDAWPEILRSAEGFLPSPGVPDHHAAVRAAHDTKTPILSEFDLAGRWDDRPIVAITGTDGKTTVTKMTVAMLEASGLRTVDAGNTDVPLVEAIADPTYDLFVVEASSFRLGYSATFAPRVGTWLNLGPDHLDKHTSFAAYAEAKASIWSRLPEDGLAVAHVDSPDVMKYLRPDRHSQTFGLDRGDHRVLDGQLMIAGEPLLAVAEMRRSLPHDQTNALAAAATALAGGATMDGVAQALRDFRGLPHRVEWVGSADGVDWYNDSKATTPHAVEAAVSGFDSVVLIAGGKNKGLDMSGLRALAHRIDAVVAIGASSADIVATFAGAVPTHEADSMQAAVQLAGDLATPGSAVLLSPACASFDMYANYKERGRDFTAEVHRLLGAATLTDPENSS